MELDFYQNMEMESAVNSKKMRDMLEMEQVFYYLLDEEKNCKELIRIKLKIVEVL